jgi:hypothetical protein
MLLSSLQHPIKANQSYDHGCGTRFLPKLRTDSSEEAKKKGRLARTGITYVQFKSTSGANEIFPFWLGKKWGKSVTSDERFFTIS